MGDIVNWTNDDMFAVRDQGGRQVRFSNGQVVTVGQDMRGGWYVGDSSDLGITGARYILNKHEARLVERARGG